MNFVSGHDIQCIATILLLEVTEFFKYMYTITKIHKPCSIMSLGKVSSIIYMLSVLKSDCQLEAKTAEVINTSEVAVP